MTTACQREGHGYVHTAHGRSRRCVWCGAIRWPWSREQAQPDATIITIGGLTATPIEEAA